MQILIDNHSGAPIYDQIFSQIKAQIISGALAPDELLPSIRALARDLRAALVFSGPVYVDNLCSFSGYACSCREPFVRSRSILYILAHNRGIGAAFVRDGKMSRGLMGEIGHTTVDFACTDRCRCGRTGCFEAMLYPSAIRQRVQRALESGTPSSLHPENLSSIYDLFRQADRGDAAARQETDRIAGLFASLLCNA